MSKKKKSISIYQKKKNALKGQRIKNTKKYNLSNVMLYARREMLSNYKKNVKTKTTWSTALKRGHELERQRVENKQNPFGNLSSKTQQLAKNKMNKLINEYGYTRKDAIEYTKKFYKDSNRYAVHNVLKSNRAYAFLDEIKQYAIDNNDIELLNKIKFIEDIDISEVDSYKTVETIKEYLTELNSLI